MQPRAYTGARFTPRPDPGGDLVRYVERGVGSAMWRHRARVKVHAPAERVIARVPPAVIVEEIDEHACFANVGSGLARMTSRSGSTLLDADFDASHDAELARRAPPARRAPGPRRGIASRNDRFRGVVIGRASRTDRVGNMRRLGRF